MRWGGSCVPWCLGAILAVATSVQAADGIAIVPLVRDGRVLVSFTFEDGVTDNLSAAIQSGLETTFTYTVDLRVQVPAWVDRTIASATISNTVHYDTLTRRHTVVRSVDGRVEDELNTEDESLVREMLTTFTRVPLFSSAPLEPNREYYIRVRAQTRPHDTLFPVPWREGPSGQTTFTFIP